MEASTAKDEGTSGDPVAGRRSTFRCSRSWRGCGHFMRPGFRQLGGILGRWPKCAILISLVVTAICASGLVMLEVDYGYRVWYDSTTTSYIQWDRIDQVWNNDFSFLEVLVVDPAPSDLGVLDPDCLGSAEQFRFDILRKLPSGACGSIHGSCEYSLFSELEAAGQPVSNATSFLSDMAAQNGGDLPYEVGGYVARVCCGANVTQASALRLSFHSLDKQSADIDAFEADIVDHCNSWTPPSTCPTVQVNCLAGSSYELEQAQAMQMDQTLMGVAVVLMLLYMAAMLGRSRNCKHSKVSLGMSVIAAVGFSLGISFGIGGFFGIPFTQMSMLAIFILLGVGIDDAFVLNDAFERTKPTDGLDIRLSEALEEAGPSVFLTSVTDFVAFLVGVSINVAAIRSFCISAAIAVLAVFALQVTWFAPLLVLNARRAAAGRCDVLPCFPVWPKQVAIGASEPEHSPVKGYIDQGETSAIAEEAKCEAKSAGKEATAQPAKFERIVRACFRPWAVGLIVGLFFIVFATSLYLIQTNLSKGSKSSDYVAEDSYLLDFWDAEEANFGFRGGLTLYADPVDLSNDAQLQKLADALTALESMPEGIQPRPETWVDAFITWRAGAGATSLSLRSDFIVSAEGSRYVDDMVPAGGDRVIGRASLFVYVESDSQGRLDLMNQARDAVDAVIGDQFNAFVWSPFFLTADRFALIDKVIVQSIVMALIAIGAVCYLMLPPTAATASLIAIALVNVDIMGFASWWGVQMSVSTAAILVLALGFSVDYAAHIAVDFCGRLYKRNVAHYDGFVEIIVEDLQATGVSVMHAGTSTLLAVIVLAFSVTKGFQDLFKCFFLMVLFGLLHGLILEPILVVLFGNWFLLVQRCLTRDGLEKQPGIFTI